MAHKSLMGQFLDCLPLAKSFITPFYFSGGSPCLRIVFRCNLLAPKHCLRFYIFAEWPAGLAANLPNPSVGLAILIFFRFTCCQMAPMNYLFVKGIQLSSKHNKNKDHLLALGYRYDRVSYIVHANLNVRFISWLCLDTGSFAKTDYWKRAIGMVTNV